MKIARFFLDQLDRELPATRRVIERVPEGKNVWKPHEKSMPMGYLAALVAGMPAWIEMMVENDEFDIWPEGAKSPYTPKQQESRADLLELLDDSVAKARKSLEGTNDDHLEKHWRMFAQGHQVSDQPRVEAIADGFFSHWAHHRGQLTVYLRLNDASVPSVYGPSADERQ